MAHAFAARRRALAALAAAALLGGSRTAASRFELANVFQSGMVVQRGAPITLWGWSAPGAPVFGAMRAADSNSSLFVSAQADAASGLFRLAFPAQAAGAFDFVISSRAISDRCSQGPYLFSCAGWGLILSSVYVGDVVFCGGQSAAFLAAPGETAQIFSIAHLPLIPVSLQAICRLMWDLPLTPPPS